MCSRKYTHNFRLFVDFLKLNSTASIRFTNILSIFRPVPLSLPTKLTEVEKSKNVDCGFYVYQLQTYSSLENCI